MGLFLVWMDRRREVRYGMPRGYRKETMDKRIEFLKVLMESYPKFVKVEDLCKILGMSQMQARQAYKFWKIKGIPVVKKGLFEKIEVWSEARKTKVTKWRKRMFYGLKLKGDEEIWLK